ncbi:MULTISPECIES: helix-turn-helix domain-containing protein [Paenibacillus]|uniref:HTH cro/C1-type domain-containing protein n=1 Tax=Paenibacillus albilobatus TaxID=2716884 RepID=A0A920C9B3_9BACL|nr:MULTISPECIES: helix-turn-helix transcriptional regulator [Paenibacillus]GIO31061.1 hypothetical protein J2TS6_22020 [Paenibacillus albilobatus]
MAKTQLEDMGERLKTARINRKLTKNEVYWRTQIQPDTLGLYETAQTEPDLLSLAKLSDAYRVSLDWLITGFEFHSKSRLMQAEAGDEAAAAHRTGAVAHHRNDPGNGKRRDPRKRIDNKKTGTWPWR